MGQQGQRGILVPEGYNYVSFGERRCNIKGRMQLTWKNEAALERLGLKDVFTGTIGNRVRYDLPNYVLQGVMVNMRGVTSFSNYLCFMNNILNSEQHTNGMNMANLALGQDRYLFARKVMSQDTNPASTVPYQVYNFMGATSNGNVNLTDSISLGTRFEQMLPSSAEVRRPPWPKGTVYEPGSDIRLSGIKGASWGSTKSFIAPFYRETVRYPISDRRLELELWAPNALNLELTVYPTVNEGAYTYLWPGEELSEWVNINPMSGVMPIKQFYWVEGEGPVQLAEYSYKYHVDYFLEVKLHPTGDV